MYTSPLACKKTPGFIVFVFSFIRPRYNNGSRLLACNDSNIGDVCFAHVQGSTWL